MKKRIVIGCLALGACGPMSADRAADLCEDRARSAQGVTGEVGIGVGSNGASSSLELGVTSDFLLGRDPQQVYESCVRQKTGQGPVRPLDLS